MRHLTDFEDAYGHEIHDYWKGQRGIVEIVERNDGYVDVSGGPHYYFAEFNRWPKQQKLAIRSVRGRVLDLGCGAGRVLAYLQAKGFEATGIDSSPLAVRVCAERKLSPVYLRSVLHIGPDMGIFDTVIMFGNNFGLFGSRRRAKSLLRKLYKMTSPEGRIVAESTDPYATSLAEHLAYHRLNRTRGRMGGQIRLRIRYKKYMTPWFDYLLASRDEAVSLVKGSGWQVERFIDSGAAQYVVILNKA